MSKSKTTMNAPATILACLAFFVAASCGGPKASVREIPPSVYSRLDRGVTSYGEAGRELFADEEKRFASLVTKFTGGLHRTLHPKFHHDPRLDSVAWLVAHAFADKETRVAPELRQWAVDRLGVVGDVVMAPAWAWDGSYGKQHIAESLAEFSKEMRRADWDGERYVFGVARLRVPPERFALGMVVVEQAADLEDVPKRVEPGGTIPLKGQVLGRPESAWVELSVSDLESYRFALPLDRSGRFSVEIPAPTEPGVRHLAMGSWSRASWSRTILDVPLYVGVDEPSRPDASILAPASNPPPGSEWDRRIVQAMNDLRRNHGIEPLDGDPGLDRVIGERIGKQAAEPYHRLPPIQFELLRAGLDWRQQSSFNSRFEFLSEAVSKLSKDVDLRGLLLDPRYDRLGVATVAEPHKGSGPRMYRAGFVVQLPPEVRDASLSDGLAAAIRRDVPRYDDPASRPGETGPWSAPEFAAGLERALEGPAGGRVRHEPALDALAAEYLAQGDLHGAADDLVLRRLGLTGDLHRVKTRLVRREDPGPHLVAEIASRVNEDEEARSFEYLFGVAREPRGEGLFLETVAVVTREVAFEPFPRRVEPGEEIIIEGRFLAGGTKGGACDLRSPRLWMGGASRETIKIELKVDGDCGFTTKVAAPVQPGVYAMELTHTPVEIVNRHVEFSTHTAARAEILVGGVAAPEPDPSLFRVVDEPVPAGERLEIIRRKLRDVREEAGLAPLEENRLATAFVADNLLRRYHRRAAMAYGKLSDVFEANGGGETSMSFGGELLRVAEKMDLRFADPSIRKDLLDPLTVGYGLATDPDGDVYRLLLVERPGGEADKGAGADSRFGSAATGPELLPRPAILAPAAVAEALEKGRKKLIRCFKDEAAWIDDDYEVTARFGLAVGTAGKVIAAWPEDDKADPRGLEACILDELRALSFPAPTPGAHGPGAVIVSRQLRFTRKGEGKVELAIGE